MYVVASPVPVWTMSYKCTGGAVRERGAPPDCADRPPIGLPSKQEMQRIDAARCRAPLRCRGGGGECAACERAHVEATVARFCLAA
jgi:hypothetical protein